MFTVRVSPLLINFMVLTAGYTLTFSRYVAENKKWTRGVHKDGDTCNHVNDSSAIGTEEEDTCEDCLSGSPSSRGSSQTANGKGKKKKGKNKDKKVFSYPLSDGCVVCLCHATQLGHLSTPRRQRQRERRQTKGLMIAVHVRYKSLYISLPFSAKQQREMIKFCVFWRT